MQQVLSVYAQKVSGRLRAQHQVVSVVSAWAATSWHRPGESHSPHVATGLVAATDDRIGIAKAAFALLPRIRHGTPYVRAGVVLTGLRPKASSTPLAIFEPEFEGRRIGKMLDAITQKLGPRAIGVGLGGLQGAPTWNMKRETLSRRATTHWDELCEAVA